MSQYNIQKVWGGLGKREFEVQYRGQVIGTKSTKHAAEMLIHQHKKDSNSFSQQVPA